MRVSVAWLLDLLLLTTITVIGFVVVTGGGVYSVRGVRVSMHSVDNAITALTVLAVVRYGIRNWAPFVGIRHLGADAIDSWCARTVGRLRAIAAELSGASGARLTVLLAALGFALKAWFAVTSPGFFSGDDVEIHEMTLRTLLGYEWPIWDLRSPIFPFAFVFPAQWAAHSLGVSDAGSLVIVGRLLVAAMSTLAVWLTWRIGAQLWPDQKGYAVLAAALVATAKLQIAFGSSELPRPVSTVLILSGFLLLQRRSTRGAALAGAVVAGAACLRFSETIFILPAAIQLLNGRRYSDLLVFAGAAALTMMTLLAIPDVWYWGQPFHSVRAAIDFTLVRRLSSRGFQPPWFYVASIPQWTSIPLFVLAAVGARRRPALALWAAVPIIVLSLLPHKEPRYLIPVVPFLCLLAADAVRQLAALAERRIIWAAPAVIGALALGLLSDATHYRLPRTDEDVLFARRLAVEAASANGLLVQQLWRLGGHLYFGSKPVSDLDPQQLSDPEYLRPLLAPGVWVVLDRRQERAAAATLTAHGFRPAPASMNYAVWRSGSGFAGFTGFDRFKRFTRFRGTNAAGADRREDSAPSMRSHEDLVAWQLSEKLKDHVYEIIARPAAREDRDFCDDIRRSGRSAPANLSEGFGRYRPRDNARFVRTAIASLAETINHLGHARKQQIISQDEHRQLVRLAKRARGAAIGYLLYLNSCPPDGPKPQGRQRDKKAAENPSPENPSPENSAPENSAPENSEPENPEPENPEPEP